MNGLNVVEVQFRKAGRLYDFLSDGHELRVGDKVVVETERGPSLATVARVKFLQQLPSKDRKLKGIVRKATRKDLERKSKLTPEGAEDFTRKKVRELKLDMRVLKSDIQFGGNKVIIFFSAPGRVDFRELVKELAGGLRARVELKQVGARDEAKLIGGVGICGREFCCSSWLREFVPVSIKMAKNQNLALNPSKVSGGCGRLLCCLTYENELYTDLRQKVPPRGTRLRLQDGTFGDVLKADFLNQQVLVELDDGSQVSVLLSETTVVDRKAGLTEQDDWGEDLDLEELMSDKDEA